MNFIKNLRLGRYIKNEVFNTRTVDYIDFCPTWKCNARCATCGAWKRDKFEMQPTVYNTIVSNFKSLRKLIIEGGEPTLWNYLFDFLYRFMKFHPKCRTHVITNGFRTESIDILAKLLKKDFKNQLSWSVSLNGLGKTHDKSRGVKNVFDRTVESAKILRDYGYKVAFSYVPFKENVHEYEDVLSFAKSLNIELWVCYYSKGAKFGEHQTWTQDQSDAYDFVYENTLKTQKFYQKWAYEYFLDHVRRKAIMPCWSGRSAIHIDPEGVIRPCHLDESMKIGQVTDENVKWDSDREETLKRIPEKCQYATGELCNDCYVFWTVRNSMPKVLKWKIL